jgi:hypothetical protein
VARAAVRRVKTDFRTLATALEAYRLDHNDYPDMSRIPHDDHYGPLGAYTQLTSPVAYITNVSIRDPFKRSLPEQAGDPFQAIGSDWISYGYVNLPARRGAGSALPTPPNWMLQSQGPDHMDSGHRNPPGWGRGSVSAYSGIDPRTDYYWCRYDPTNGTVSWGDILRFGP